MSAIRLRSRRHPLAETAIISHGDRSIECAIADLSVDGARLLIEGAGSVPDRFDLTATPGGIPRRCRTIWQHKGQIGVQFVA